MGDSIQRMSEATNAISVFSKILKKSKIYKTAAWGKKDQNDFLNQALLIETDLVPEELLKKILDIEIQLGRIRNDPWGPRTIDIDILLYNDAIIDKENLKIPHPYLHLRNFNLVPLAEIYDEWLHPLLHQNASEMLKNCPDDNKVENG